VNGAREHGLESGEAEVDSLGEHRGWEQQQGQNAPRGQNAIHIASPRSCENRAETATMTDRPSRATLLIREVGEGNRQAAAELLPLVYDELRQLARIKLAREKPGQTLQPTALVHEAYLRLVGATDPGWEGRRHFFAAAAEAMRRILIERARRRAAEKHGGGAERVTLQDVAADEAVAPETLLAVDAALTRLESIDPEMADVVKLRYFAGMSVEETAESLQLSPRTVNRHWTGARAWLQRELGTS
jgi:RNA polymerase sigma factor (TIGR02999 family)